MSLTIFLQCFENGDVSTFKRSIAWNIFGPKAVKSVMGWWLTYDGVPAGELWMDDDELIGGVAVNRPGDAALRDLYALARLVPATINRDSRFLVADPAVLQGIPDWLLKVLPTPPIVVHSADDFLYRMFQRLP